MDNLTDNFVTTASDFIEKKRNEEPNLNFDGNYNELKKIQSEANSLNIPQEYIEDVYNDFNNEKIYQLLLEKYNDFPRIINLIVANRYNDSVITPEFLDLDSNLNEDDVEKYVLNQKMSSVDESENMYSSMFNEEDNITKLKNNLSKEELQKIFDDVQEQEKNDIKTLTIQEFLRKLLDSLFYFLIDVFENNENIITAATKENRALFIGIDILILIIFIKIFIL